MLLHKDGLDYYREQVQTALEDDSEPTSLDATLNELLDDLNTIATELKTEGDHLPSMYEGILDNHLVGSKGYEHVLLHVEEEKELVADLQRLVDDILPVTEGSPLSSKDTSALHLIVDRLHQLQQLCRDTAKQLHDHTDGLDDLHDEIATLAEREATFADNINSWVSTDKPA